MTLEQLKDKWTEQDGKCAISFLPMRTGTHVDYKCSPERLDNNTTYTDENVVLIIAELNIGQSKQFTRNLLVDICQPDTNEHPSIDEIDSLGDRKNTTINVYGPLVTRIDEQQVTLYQCVVCEEFKEIAAFTIKDKKTQRRSRTCRTCDNIKSKSRVATTDGKLNRILGHARSSTRRRNSVQNRCETTFEITIDDLGTMLKAQKGKCHYSQKNLTFDGKAHFHISLERKDVNIGYTKDNCVFICEELNTTNQSAIQSLHDQEKQGNAGWTQTKFDNFRKEINLQEIT
ncbi:MAG: hypothetical protein EOP45_21640, partial [Sphingobacteriaceae bacterium]